MSCLVNYDVELANFESFYYINMVFHANWQVGGENEYTFL